MEKIFYGFKNAYFNSETVIKEILTKSFGISNPQIKRTENGKPFLLNPPFPLHFSVTHTNEKVFIAFSDKEIGVDSEPIERHTDFLPILNRFPLKERNEIRSEKEFLLHWTAKESAVKYLGTTLAKDLRNLYFDGKQLFYNDEKLPVSVTFLHLDNTLVCVCAEKDFLDAEIIPFP